MDIQRRVLFKTDHPFEQALSAEMIATSTLLSYDVYRHYFRPDATSQEIVTASRVFIVFWGIFAGALASIFNAVGIVSE